MNYYKRHIGDYAKKAGRLTILQHGAYTLLIDACYDREQFPTKEQAIDWCWASTPEEVAAVEFVLMKFFTLEDDVYTQKRIAEELEKYHENAKTNQRIAIEREAKKRAAKTKRTEKSTERDIKSTEREPGVNEAPPNHKPLTTNHKPLTNTKNPMSTKADTVRQVFDYWCEVMGKNPNATKLNAKRKSAIQARLKEGYTLDQLKQSIDGCKADPFSMGQNERNKPFNDIELICRNGTKVEGFWSVPMALPSPIAASKDQQRINGNIEKSMGWLDAK